MSRKFKTILTLILVVSLLPVFSLAAFAEAYSSQDVLEMSRDLADVIDATGSAVPETIHISSGKNKKKIRVESALYLMAKWLELYGYEYSAPKEVPYLEIKKPDTTKPGVTTGQINREDLIQAGNDVAAILEADPKMPPSFIINHTDTGNTVEAEVNPYSLIYCIARALRWTADKATLPNYSAVRKTILPGSLARPELFLTESFISYTGDRANFAPDRFSEKLGLNFTGLGLSAYYPAMVRSAGGDHEYLSDPDDRWEFKYRLGSFNLKATNNYTSFDGIPRDPFFAVRNMHSDSTTSDFYKIAGKLLGGDYQFHQVITTKNEYLLGSSVYGLGNYKLNVIYGERASLTTDETSENNLLWLDGPMPFFNGNGTMSAAWIYSDNNIPKSSTVYEYFNGTGDGLRLAVKDVRIGRFTFEGVHFQTDSNLTSLWATGVESVDFVGSGRFYSYGKVSTDVRSFGHNVKISLSGSQETNERYNIARCNWPNEEVTVKLLFEVQPVSSLKLYTSVQSSEAYAEELGTAEHLLGTNTQWAGGLQKDFREFRLNVDAAYNYGYPFDRNLKDFVEPNWSVYVNARNRKSPLDPILGAYYQYNLDSEKPADLRTYARINGKITRNFSANVAILNAEKSTAPSWDRLYQYYGMVYTTKGFTINTGYLVNKKDRLYFSASQKIKAATLSLTYGVETGLGDGDSRNRSIDDGRPWEALMGSFTSGTDPQYTLKLRMPVK